MKDRLLIKIRNKENNTKRNIYADQMVIFYKDKATSKIFYESYIEEDDEILNFIDIVEHFSFYEVEYLIDLLNKDCKVMKIVLTELIEHQRIKISKYLDMLDTLNSKKPNI